MTEIKVAIADYAVARSGTRLITVGLGSCVAIALHGETDTEKVGGLAHIMLPHAALSLDTSSPGKFASTAVPHMMAQLRALGVTNGVQARLVGGASMFQQLLPPGAISLGARNIAAARAACAGAGVPIIAEDTGGGHGRTVYFEIADGRLLVRSVSQGNVEL